LHVGRREAALGNRGAVGVDGENVVEHALLERPEIDIALRGALPGVVGALLLCDEVGAILLGEREQHLHRVGVVLGSENFGQAVERNQATRDGAAKVGDRAAGVERALCLELVESLLPRRRGVGLSLRLLGGEPFPLVVGLRGFVEFHA
jgi:hypothetical protein